MTKNNNPNKTTSTSNKNDEPTVTSKIVEENYEASMQIQTAELESQLPEYSSEISTGIIDKSCITEEKADDQKADTISLHSIQDVPVVISAVLGERKIDIASLKKLGTGSVIDMNRKVGEPIDLYVNDNLVARGELVLVDGSLGVSMTEIIHREQEPVLF